MATSNDNKELGSKQSNRMLDGFGKQVAGLFGDTLFALIVGVVCLFIFGAVVALIWDLVNKVL